MIHAIYILRQIQFQDRYPCYSPCTEPIQDIVEADTCPHTSVNDHLQNLLQRLQKDSLELGIGFYTRATLVYTRDYTWTKWSTPDSALDPALGGGGGSAPPHWYTPPGSIS